MKHLSKLLLATMFIFSCTFIASAQTENNPWAVGIETNVVDFYPVGATAPQGSLFNEFVNTEDHWNYIPSISKLSIMRYLGAGFSVGVEGSLNKIDKFGDMEIEKMSYYSAGANFQYSFGHLIYSGQGGWFDPYLKGGANATWLDNTPEITGALGLGFNFWINDHFAITLNSTYNGSLNHNYTNYSHFQHAAGIKIAIGGIDTDGDGIYDKHDDCPNEAGLPEFNGCPDSDGDGIPNHLDDCPTEAGLPEFDGCPDTDGDGVPNHLDECPTEAGLPEHDGCPDSDGDGIPDHLDECADEAGPKENNGCPWPDKDGDGVPDHLDQCPDVAGPASNHGCPEIPDEPVVKQLNEYSKSIEFDLSKATIRSESHGALQSIADVMKDYPTANFHLAGFTDSTGSAAINEKLSNERAQSVRTYLVDELGIEADRLTSKGYGPKNPIATNKTAAGRQKNRRVEIILKKDRDQLEEDLK